MISCLILVVIFVFLLGYFLYGRFLSGKIDLDDSVPTPACQINDGIDYVPAKPALLFGQHFSAIAAAGPIVGPILACLWFGWAPVLYGSSSDPFSSEECTICSVWAPLRHKAASIGEIVKLHMSPLSHKFFSSLSGCL